MPEKMYRMRNWLHGSVEGSFTSDKAAETQLSVDYRQLVGTFKLRPEAHKVELYRMEEHYGFSQWVKYKELELKRREGE